MTIAELFAKLTIKPDKRSFDAADKAIGFLKSALLGLVAVKTASFFAGMVESTVEAGGHIDDLAQASGQTRESLQELAYGAQQNGIGMDEMGGIVTKLSRNMYEATNGNKAMAKSFAHAGIAIREADGSIRPAADVLEDMADMMAKMPDGTKKTALAMEFLGKSGAAAVPLLNAGGDGIRAYRKEAHEMGAVMSEDTVKALDAFGDETDKAKAALTGLKNDAVAAILPTLKELLDGFMTWIRLNREVIKQKLQTIFKLMAAGLKLFAKAIGVVVTILDFMGRHLDLVAVAVLALVTAITLFKLASIAAAIESGIAWALSVLPILLLAAAIAAVILIVEDLYQWFTGGDSVLKDLWESAKKYLTWDKIAEKIKSVFKDALEGIKSLAHSAWDAITGTGDSNMMERALDAAAREEKGKQMGLTGEDLERYTADDSVNYGIRNIRDQENGAATLTVPTSAEETSGPRFNANVTINGANGTPEQNAKAMTDALDQHWQGQMRKAAAKGGVK